MAKGAKIPNVYWRNGWAWGRTTHRGKDLREPLDTKDPKVARSRVEKWLEGLRASKWGEKPRRSFEEAASRFIDEHIPLLKGGATGRTAAGYLRALAVFDERFKGLYLDEIGSDLISTYEHERRREGVTGGTIRGDLFVLSSVMSRAEEWEWITGNRVAAYLRGRAKTKHLVAQPHRTRYCSHDEEAELLRRCRGTKLARDGKTAGDHLMLFAGIALTIDIGLRSEELLQGDWTMVDLKRNEWTVPDWLAKSGNARTVPILERSQKILRTLPRSREVPFVLWHSERGADKRYTNLLPALTYIATGGRSRYIRHELMKLAAKGEEITDEVRARVEAEAEKVAWADEIPDLIWHDLRRTCGCRLLQDHDMSLEKVSKWLGHASPEITRKAYAFLEVQQLHEAAGTLPKALSDQSGSHGTTDGNVLDLVPHTSGKLRGPSNASEE